MFTFEHNSQQLIVRLTILITVDNYVLLMTSHEETFIDLRLDLILW